MLGVAADEYEAMEDVGALMALQLALWTAAKEFPALTASWKDMPLTAVDSEKLEKVGPSA